jgi:CheY-like chemotaxis protein
MIKLLRRAGHEARCALNGREALDLIPREPPDIILLDVMMPEMSGIDVLKHLRTESNVRIPVIIFSALSDPAIRKEALSLGANDYWVKASMDIQDILARLARYLPA